MSLSCMDIITDHREDICINGIEVVQTNVNEAFHYSVIGAVAPRGDGRWGLVCAEPYGQRKKE